MVELNTPRTASLYLLKVKYVNFKLFHFHYFSKQPFIHSESVNTDTVWTLITENSQFCIYNDIQKTNICAMNSFDILPDVQLQMYCETLFFSMSSNSHTWTAAMLFWATANQTRKLIEEFIRTYITNLKLQINVIYYKTLLNRITYNT
jgi:hypothetical protein